MGCLVDRFAFDCRKGGSPSISLPGVAMVLLAHGAVVALLVSLDVVPNPLEIKPLTVLIMPEAVKVEPPRQSLPQKIVRPVSPAKAPAPSPVLAASANAPVANVQEAPVAEAAPPIRAAATEMAVSQPRFDADYLDNPAPVYPGLSRRMGEEGKVYLRVYVQADGRPGRIEVKTGSGSPRLDQAAEQAVWRWKFIPAKRGNEAVGAWVVVPISFYLKG